MTNIACNINRVRDRLADAARAAGRDPAEVALVAVSKSRPAGCIRDAVAAGVHDFGENYLQEALDKMAALSDLAIRWHFIGPIQSNKTRAIAEHFHWVHSLDRLKVAERLSAQRPAHLGPIDVCIQVNIDAEDSKSGVAPDAVPALAEAIAALPNLRLRGLMAIPAPAADGAARRTPFFYLAQLLANLRTLAPALASLDTLSMGMSDDLEAAVAEGATLVRVGTALFGERSGAADTPNNANAENPS
ncbi:MAG: YggS family pyridoxal phosphate-dependent enzyme [Bacteroidales bacterium]|nr:YggS family pyridoxal phosphate-dependent enzyme [Bacteroidales bacterium]